jgi:hypothetical protein
MKAYLAAVTLSLYGMGMIAFVGFVFRVPVTWWGALLMCAVCLALAFVHAHLFEQTGKSK